MPRVGYTGQGANLTEDQIQKLDSVTLGCARKNLKLLAGFLTAPLIHHQLINHPLPSSIYYEARLGSLWRNLGRAGRPSTIIQEHLDRALDTTITNDRHSTCRWRELLDKRLTDRTTTIRVIPTSRRSTGSAIHHSAAPHQFNSGG